MTGTEIVLSILLGLALLWAVSATQTAVLAERRVEAIHRFWRRHMETCTQFHEEEE